jgi:hypothetical protein
MGSDRGTDEWRLTFGSVRRHPEVLKSADFSERRHSISGEHREHPSKNLDG